MLEVLLSRSSGRLQFQPFKRSYSQLTFFNFLSSCKKSNISNPTVFASGANSRRWGRAGPSRRRLALPTPGPAGDTFKITGPSPTRSVRFQSHATSARLGRRVANLTGRLPGLAREILNIFAVSSSCCVSSAEVSRQQRAC